MEPTIHLTVTFAMLALVSSLSATEVNIQLARSDRGFELESVPFPATNDAASDATFTLVDGQRDVNGGDLSVLHDGQVPWHADEPTQNFFFKYVSNGGRIAVDLGKPTLIESINTYSCHPHERAPQVYNLYGTKGDKRGFLNHPKRNTDPKSCGWKAITRIDTRSKGQGGQHSASISGLNGSSLGEFRYLLFDIDSPDKTNPQANTFFSEVDIIAVNGPELVPVPARVQKTYRFPEEKFTLSIDTTQTPDLEKWVDDELIPVVREWYPKIVAMLSSDNYTAPENLEIMFRGDMKGIPAYATGHRLSLNAHWFRTQLQGEAKGCVVHEIVHVVQNYGRAATTNPKPSKTPGWVTEGIADYVRWFIYEPESKGAEITKDNFQNGNYDASYRISANFLNWLVQTNDKDFIRKLNAVAREGTYSEDVWKRSTGKSASELGEEWKTANANRLGL